MGSRSKWAPPASRIRSVAVMISGPMPSPYATVTGTLLTVMPATMPHLSAPLLGVPTLADAVRHETLEVVDVRVAEGLVVDEGGRRVAQQERLYARVSSPPHGPVERR